MDYIEILGIIATVFVLISFLMKTAWKIRIINIIGALIFVVYGIIMGAWSVWILNAALVLVHICYLFAPKVTKSPKTSHTSGNAHKSKRKLHFIKAQYFNVKGIRKSEWFKTMDI